jgi:hypothetical protein
MSASIASACGSGRGPLRPSSSPGGESFRVGLRGGLEPLAELLDLRGDLRATLLQLDDAGVECPHFRPAVPAR